MLSTLLHTKCCRDSNYLDATSLWQSRNRIESLLICMSIMINKLKVHVTFLCRHVKYHIPTYFDLLFVSKLVVLMLVLATGIFILASLNDKKVKYRSEIQMPTLESLSCLRSTPKTKPKNILNEIRWWNGRISVRAAEISWELKYRINKMKKGEKNRD